MPRQNRVMPTGEIIATSARGLFMGNRGILHNAEQEVVRSYAHKMWIICQLNFKGRRRKLMQPGRYTELFFLDEATALAAGHRPCFECRRSAAEQFRDAWLAGNTHLNFGNSVKSAEIDAVLHGERLTGGYYKRDKRKRTCTAVLNTLPNGTFILWQERPYLVWQDALLPWMPAGYQPAIPRPKADHVAVLTPPSTVAALAAGYTPRLHDTAQS
ncbi:hypothetical protein [Candidatus Leptofilum sp.]|uniref:hypothetical protein n=1 Tax=Candidatus Leptofilum sp. TaxID=3241576 RepID=UPI003B5C97C6